jgi:hypothetical protein
MPDIAETRTHQNRYFFSTLPVDSPAPKCLTRNRSERSQYLTVAPAKAGVQGDHTSLALGSRFRGNVGQRIDLSEFISGRSLGREASRTEIFAGKTPVKSLFCYYGASSGLRIVYTLGSQR